jgi:hypothetical protein
MAPNALAIAPRQYHHITFTTFTPEESLHMATFAIHPRGIVVHLNNLLKENLKHLLRSGSGIEMARMFHSGND